MIKKLTELSDSKIKSIFSESVKVYEKLDMIYFKIDVNQYGAFPLKTPKFTAISDIDCVCNSIFANICNFSKTYIEPIKDSILNLYGNVTIGFFYLPISKSKHIDYTTLPNETFILSDVFTKDKAKKVSTEEFYKILPSYILKEPLIKTTKVDNINNIIRNDNEIEIIKYILGDTPTFSGLAPEMIEGIIIKTPSKQYQVIANNADAFIDKSTRKIYRDVVLHSLAANIDDVMINELKNDKTQYINKIAKVFIHFINSTDIFSKYSFDEEDLLPPHEGYFGEINLTAFNNKDIESICTLSKAAKNILRMFLHTFTNPISLNKFSDLSLEDVDKLNRLTNALKYKNFAEIALHTIK